MRGKITKEYIVDAVTEMARQNSIITDITVRKIAAHIGCSHPNIYNHYENMEELLWDVMGNIFRIIKYERERVEITHETGDERLRIFIKRWVNFVKNNVGWYKFIWYDEFKGEMPEHVKKHSNELCDSIVLFLSKAYKELEIEDKAKNVSEILISYIHGEISLLLLGRSRCFDYDDIEKKSTENFRRITGRDEEINWTNGEKETYSVYLKSKDGNKRLFEILSGGEQVAVGLSIRAAMASTLTNAGFTIFDEPTINLDVERRRYLSESLQEVLKGLEQAIIVTHDDTFEEMAERIIEV